MAPGIPVFLKYELDACVRRIAEHVLQSSSDQLRDLVLFLPKEVESVVTSVIVERNSRLASDAALLPELWCAIWLYLPFTSRIDATHVCRSWRATALACPDLWTDISVVVSRGDDPYMHPADAIVPALTALASLLHRASSAPVHLRLCLQLSDLDGDSRTFIRDVLGAHADHIVSLRFSAVCEEAVVDVVKDALPLMHDLRYLKLESLDFDVPLGSIVRPDAHFPQLRTLELDGPFFHEAGDPDMFPHVERVSFDVTQRPLSPHELENMLLSCPQTTTLCIRLHAGWWNEDAPRTLDLETFAPHLAALKIDIFSPGELHISGVLGYFRHKRLRSLTLRFEYHSAHDPLLIFSDLEQPHTLVLHRRVGMIALDVRGFAREVVWTNGMPDKAAETLTGRLASSLRTLISDATLFFSVAHMLTYPSLQTVVLRLLDAAEFPAAMPNAFPGDLPALQTLCLQLVDSRGHPCVANGLHRVDVGAVSALIESLPRRLAVLQLAQIKFRKQVDRAPLELLRSLVDGVEAVPCDGQEHCIVVDADAQINRWPN